MRLCEFPGMLSARGRLREFHAAVIPETHWRTIYTLYPHCPFSLFLNQSPHNTAQNAKTGRTQFPCIRPVFLFHSYLLTSRLIMPLTIPRSLWFMPNRYRHAQNTAAYGRAKQITPM